VDGPSAATFVDSGADHTVLTAEVHRTLGTPSSPASLQLGGIGGSVDTARVFLQLQLLKQDGQWINVGVEGFAFVNDRITDLPVLGRDVLNLFAVILDQPADIVYLIRDRHRYVIQES
jgi:hypothetical protein